MSDAFPGIEAEALTELQYSTDRKGPFKLYVFEPNSEYHRGGVWFEEHPRFPEEGEITIREAALRVIDAIAKRQEVRVCDTGDMLLYHLRGGEVLHGYGFWAEIGAGL